MVTDPDGEEGEQESWTSYQFGMDNAVRYNDLDGRQAGGGDDWYTADRKKNGLSGSAAAQPNLVSQLATPFKNFVGDLLSLTDLNDAAVLVTTFTRGSGGAVNIDGTKAGKIGIGMAALGAVIPIVSGSSAKSVGNKIGQEIGDLVEVNGKVSHAKNFDVAREAGFKKAGMTNSEKVSFSN